MKSVKHEFATFHSKNVCTKDVQSSWAHHHLPLRAPVCTAGPAELPVEEELDGPELP